ADGNDIIYEIQIDTVNTFDGGALIDKVSDTDAGFTNLDNGGDTNPFASGDQIQYTPQSPLTNATTYYWRVRAKDPSGTNTYGAWSTTRSFDVNTGASGTLGNVLSIGNI